MVAERKGLHDHEQKDIYIYVRINIYMSTHTYMALLQQIRVIGEIFHSPLRSSCKHDEFAKSRLCTDKGQRRTLRRRTMNDRRETKLEHILDKRSKEDSFTRSVLRISLFIIFEILNSSPHLVVTNGFRSRSVY